MNDKIESKTKQAEKCFLFFYAFLLVMPTKGYFIIVRPLFCFVFYLLFHVLFRKPFFINFKYFFFFLVWLFCLLLSQLVIVGTPNLPQYFHEVLRVLMYFIVFLPIQDLSIPRKHLTLLAAFFIVFNFCVQMLELFKIEAIFDFISKYYLAGDDLRHLNLARGESLSSFRSGSVFINPNVYSPLALLCLSVILYSFEIQLKRNYRKGKIWLFLITMISVISLTLTGSRTVFIALGVMLLYFLIEKVNRKPLFVVAFLFLILFCLYFLVSSGSRFTTVTEGLQDSFGGKISELIRYIFEVNPLSFLVGNNSNIGSTEWGFDFEWGYVFVYTGIIGVLDYLSIHSFLLKKYHTSDTKRLYMFVLIALIIQSLSATMLYNSYAFPLLALFVFSKEIYEE